MRKALGTKRGLHDWASRLHGHSLGWVCARRDGELIGFVNVAWDGGAHAFVLDTVVAAGHRRRAWATSWSASGGRSCEGGL